MQVSVGRSESDADQLVHGEALDKYSWSDGKKLSIHTELHDFNDQVAERRSLEPVKETLPNPTQSQLQNNMRWIATRHSDIQRHSVTKVLMPRKIISMIRVW